MAIKYYSTTLNTSFDTEEEASKAEAAEEARVANYEKDKVDLEKKIDRSLEILSKIEEGKKKERENLEALLKEYCDKYGAYRKNLPESDQFDLWSDLFNYFWN